MHHTYTRERERGRESSINMRSYYSPECAKAMIQQLHTLPAQLQRSFLPRPQRVVSAPIQQKVMSTIGAARLQRTPNSPEESLPKTATSRTFFALVTHEV